MSTHTKGAGESPPIPKQSAEDSSRRGRSKLEGGRDRTQSLEARNEMVRKRDRERATCLICETTGDDWVFIECIVCQGQMCATCSGIEVSMIKSVYYSKLPGFKWSCQACERTLPTMTNMKEAIEKMNEANERVNTTLSTMAESSDTRLLALESRLNEMEERITDKIKAEFPKMVKKEMEKVEEKLKETVQDQMTEIERKMNDRIERKVDVMEKELITIKEKTVEGKELEKKVREEIQKELRNRPETSAGVKSGGNPVSPGTQLRQTVASVTAELKSREGKRRNMVLYNLEEPKVNNDRAKREKGDREKMIEIASGVLGIKNMEEKEMIQVARLGTQTNRPRPLMIELTTEARKNQIFSKLVRLRQTEYKHLSFTHDMTKLERDQQRKLVGEAKKREKEDGGKNRFRVRGPPWDLKVVMLEKKEETTTTPMVVEEEGQTEEGKSD